jgi:hypothetical protein
VVALAGQGCAEWAAGDCAEKADCPAAAEEPADGSGPIAARDGFAGTPSADAGKDAGAGVRGADAAVLEGSAADGGSSDARTRDAAMDAPTGADAGDAARDATSTGVDAATSPDAGSTADAGAPRDTGAADVGPACVPTGPERCDDGIDNDCNGKVDCADPACGAYACVPPVPSGWQGPVALGEVPTGTTLAACPTEYKTLADVHAGLTAPAAACGCACGASGQQCSATGTFHGDQTCSGSACATVTPSPSGACTAVPVNNCGSGGSFDFTAAPTPSGGSCRATVTTTVPPAGWTEAARLCAYAGAADGAGCSDADVCIALPGASYGAKACVYSTADPPPSACPAGYVSAPPAVFYADVADTRACGACSCGGPTGGSCSGTVSLFGGTGCTGATGSATASVGTSCQSYSGLSPTPGSVEAHYTVTAGSCAVSAAPQPTGTAAGSSPTTVCCM